MYKSVWVALLIGIVVGCSGDADNDSASPQSDTSKKPPLASRLNSMDAAEQRDAAEQPDAADDGRQQQQRNSRTPADQSDITESDVRGEARGMVSPPTGEMNNGLFPKMPTVAAAGFGGALFPDFQPTGSPAEKSGAGSDVAGSSNDDDPFAEDDIENSDSDMDTESSDGMAESKSAAEITLMPAARRLFDDHAESEAINALYGHHLVSDDSRGKYELNWYPGLKEPRLFFRWGVGIIYNEPRGYSGRHPVIGDPGEEDESADGNPGTTGGRRGGSGIGSTGGGGVSGGGARTFKDVDTSRPDGFLLYYTGDFGVKLISHLEKRLSDDEPYYGEVLKDVLALKLPEAGNSADRQGNRDAAGISSAGAQSPVGSFSEGDGETGRADRSGVDNNSPAPPSEETTSIINRALGSATAEKPTDDSSGSILPGVMLLGVGSKDDLVERAKNADVDSLIVFSVNVAKSRRSARSGTAPTQTSTTSMKIIDLNDEGSKNLFSSKGLKDVDVQEMIDSGKDPVEQEIERAFREIADSEFKASELPDGLNPENVKKRIGRLLSVKPDNPLPTAVEIISFYESELLSEELANAAIKGLFGSDDAQVLVKGTAEQRLEFLKAWLPARLDE